jgi:bifunctional lysine-specific demethylase and histidyl-hydroxylase NO66
VVTPTPPTAGPTTTPATLTTTPATPEARRALARCVGEVESFLEHRFAVEPHTWSGGDFTDLLSLADVDRALTGSGLRRPAVRVVRDGEILDPATWTRRARTGSTWIDDLVSPARVLDLFAGGATVVLQSLQRWWPPVARFCRDLETALGHPVQANAYLTPPGAAGLTPHHDTHDVFVLQLHGTKGWTVRHPVVEAPLPRHRSDHGQAAAQPVRFEAEVVPGDCVYLPRGHVHSARAQDDVSLHLTIGVLATTVHDLLRRLVDATAEDPAFRRALPIGFVSDPGTAEQALKEAVRDLVDWLGRLDVAATAADLRQAAATRRAPPLEGHLLDLVALDHLGDDSRVRRRPGATCSFGVAGDRLVVALADRRLDLPAGVEEAVRLLVDGEDHAVADLDGHLDGPSRLVLVRRLVREGLLQVVPSDGAPGGP